MKKQNGQPSWTLKAQIQELQVKKKTTKRHPSKKIAAPVSVERGRRAYYNFDPDEGTSGLQLQNSSNKSSSLEQRDLAFCQGGGKGELYLLENANTM